MTMNLPLQTYNFLIIIWTFFVSVNTNELVRIKPQHDKFQEASQLQQIPQTRKFETRCCTAKFAWKLFT